MNTAIQTVRRLSTGGLLLYLVTMPAFVHATTPSEHPSSGTIARPLRGAAEVSAPQATGAVTFSSVWLEHGVRMRGRNGFMIHANFIVKNRTNVKCQLAVYFYDETGSPVPAVGSSGPTRTPAIIWRTINPQYPSTEYKDYQIFVPTTTFHALAKGSYTLRARIYVLSENHQIGESDRYEFNLTL